MGRYTGHTTRLPGSSGRAMARAGQQSPGAARRWRRFRRGRFWTLVIEVTRTRRRWWWWLEVGGGGAVPRGLTAPHIRWAWGTGRYITVTRGIDDMGLKLGGGGKGGGPGGGGRRVAHRAFSRLRV